MQSRDFFGPPGRAVGLRMCIIQCVPLATEPGISLVILPLMRLLQRNLKWNTDTFLFISHTTNVLLFKFRCNIFIGVTIIKEMPCSVASGTHCTFKGWGTAVAQWLRCCATNRKVAVSNPAGLSGFFIDVKSFRSQYGPGVDSASNINECQEYFLAVKAAGA